MSTLGERLRRLRDTPEPPLARLETSLLGETGEGLSLKQRLERLVAAAARSRSRGIPGHRSESADPIEPRPRPVPIEELIAGHRVENQLGEFFMVEEDTPIEGLHGSIPLTRVRTLSATSVATLCSDPTLLGFDLGQAVFLDTETTGLAGGAGTAAFLVGIGYVDGDRFRVRQYFMRDYHEEAALLHGLAQDLARFSRIVTFNGKSFDIPLLESRFRLNRSRFPLTQAPHLDLLHPARRLWKLRLESCRLQALEVALLDLRRVGDIPGEEIPKIYFDYVRSLDARAMSRVLEHNRLDIVSLAALSILACQWVEEGHADDPLDMYALARVLERDAQHDRSASLYARVLAAGEGPARVPAILRLAARAKQAGDHATAAAWWEEAAQAGDVWAMRELAVHHEHRGRDLEAALGAVERGLARLEGWDGPGTRRARADLNRRRRRLIHKLGRSTTGSPRVRC